MTQKPSADIARIDDRVAEKIMTDLKAAEPSTRRRATERVIMVALSAIPWVGGVLSAAASFKRRSRAISRPTDFLAVPLA